ncbi:MAG: phenylalanine--tRNA ligase subunit beta [Nanoarchaeota archaeon]
MATITISKSDLEKLVGKKLSNEVLAEKLAMLGTSVEKITRDFIELEIFPNRPDLLSTEGIARALSSFIGIKKGIRNYSVKKSDYVVNVDKKVALVRPFVVAAVVKNVKLSNEIVQSIMQLQEKLHITFGRNRKKASIGVYDLDTISFPLTYTTKTRDFKFTPLEFKKKLTLSQILQIHPKGKEYAHLLDNFDEFPIWLDANNQVLSMPPVINSEETKVTQTTKNLFIDVTGLDKKTIERALNIIVAALADRGAEIYSVKVENKTYPNLSPKKTKLNLNYVNKLLGIKLNNNQLKTMLSKMGYGFANFVLIPPYRTDILHEVDLIEDIAIAYGYENFKEEIPKVATIAEENSLEKFKSKIAEILVGLGLTEVNTFHLTNINDATKRMNHNINAIELEKAVNEDYNVLRPWLLPNLIKVLENNKHNQYPQNIFEIGIIFKKDLSEATRLAVVLCNNEANFTQIKQIFDALFNAISLDYKIEEAQHNSFIGGRVGRISVKGKDIAYIGDIHPAVLENFGLEMPVSAFELNLTELFNLI